MKAPEHTRNMLGLLLMIYIYIYIYTHIYIYILHHLREPKLWKLGYIPYYGLMQDFDHQPYEFTTPNVFWTLAGRRFPEAETQVAPTKTTKPCGNIQLSLNPKP